jgi:hypothetical protein
MAYIDGDDFINGAIFSFQEANRMKNNWRGAAAPANIQPGMIFSDSDDDRLYIMGTNLQKIIKQADSGEIDNVKIRTGLPNLLQSLIHLFLDVRQYRMAFPDYSSIDYAFFNAYFSQVIAGEIAYERFLDIGIKGAPDGTYGASTIRFLVNSALNLTDPSEILRIVGRTGNIGIGTKNPTEKIELVGNFKITAGKINIICLDNNVVCINNDVVLG